MFVANHLIYSDVLLDNSDSMQKVIVQALINKDPSEWPNQISTYDKLITDHTLSLVTQESLNEKDRQQLIETKNKSVVSEIKLGEADLYTLSPLPNSSWILKIDENDSSTPLNDIMDKAIIFFMLFSTLAFALFLLIRKLTAPIQHLTQVAKKLGQGKWSARADSGLTPPMDTLAQGFNSMADQLNSTLQEQQVLIGAIPHELRSPLGKVRFALDMTRNSETIELLRQDIENIDSYVDEMETTVDEILDLNRLQNQSTVSLSPFDIYQLLHNIVALRSNEATTITININCQPSMKISAHPPLLKRAIENLLQNAERYAKSTINITAQQDEDGFTLLVDDDGPGIPEDQRSSLFTPFTTLDSSRNRSTGGIGLGLAIVKLVMDKHGGEVFVSTSPMNGARFELNW
ncbi:ATP-binding protein [Candidatus Gracilibacteria bacterium]|nr:ATP-binding protein [Candidatus Gracilibacteria bacterium]